MKILFINSCIREESRTKKLSDKYIAKHFSSEDISERILQNELILPFNRLMLEQRVEDIENKDYSGERYRLAREFNEADILLIAAPYWDCSFPSVLKAYIEHICVDGLTFVYDNGVPVKRNKVQKMVYITTSGGYIPENSSLEIYLKELCGLLCIPELEFHKAQGLDIWGCDIDATLNAAANNF